MKYLLTAGALVIVAAGYFLLSSNSGTGPNRGDGVPIPDVAATDPASTAILEKKPENGSDDLQDTPSDALTGNPLLEAMAAETRANLPSSVMSSLAMTDAQFLPNMRIMEYTYVTTAPPVRTRAQDMRALIGASAEALCLEERDMFGMGATLRISFEDGEGTLFQRVYLLPEDCQQFY